MGFDHFCLLIGRAVGARTIGRFMRLLLWLVTGCAYIVICATHGVLSARAGLTPLPQTREFQGNPVSGLGLWSQRPKTLSDLRASDAISRDIRAAFTSIRASNQLHAWLLQSPPEEWPVNSEPSKEKEMETPVAGQQSLDVLAVGETAAMNAAADLPMYWVLPLQFAAGEVWPEATKSTDRNEARERGSWVRRAAGAIHSGNVLSWLAVRVGLAWMQMQTRLELQSVSMGRSFAVTNGRLGSSIVFSQGLWTGLSVVWVFIVAASAMVGFIVLLGNTVLGSICSTGGTIERAEFVRERSMAISRAREAVLRSEGVTVEGAEASPKSNGGNTQLHITASPAKSGMGVRRRGAKGRKRESAGHPERETGGDADQGSASTVANASQVAADSVTVRDIAALDKLKALLQLPRQGEGEGSVVYCLRIVMYLAFPWPPTARGPALEEWRQLCAHRFEFLGTQNEPVEFFMSDF